MNQNDETDLRGLMSEPVGDPNYGSKASAEPEKSGKRLLPLDVETMLTNDLMRSKGFVVIEASRGSGATGGTYGAGDMGMTAHRGVLHPDEYVDYFDLREMVEADLGFTYAEITAVYKQGPKSADQRQHREAIDSRLLALSRAGGNMAEFGKAVGLNEKTIDRALGRAREVEVVPMFKNPVVIADKVCLKCGLDGGVPRKRRHSTSPTKWIGTVNLCAVCFSGGFESRPGNPKYWEHRLGTTPLKGSYTAPKKAKQTFPAEYPDDAAYRQFVGQA